MIAKALARYKFLTYKQMSLLGIDKHRPNLRKIVAGLTDRARPFVKTIPREEGTPLKFFLTRKGKDLLVELYGVDPETILYPKGTISKDTQDKKHRTTTVTLQVQLDLACREEDIQVLFAHRYFDTAGSARERTLKSKTAFYYTDSRTVKADIIFMLQTPKQQELYTIELENGKETEKGVEKCIKHAQAVLRGSLNHRFNLSYGYRSLWVFEHESIMLKTLERLQTVPLFENLREYFLFKTIDQFADSVFTDWLNVSGDRKNLYYI